MEKRNPYDKQRPYGMIHYIDMIIRIAVPILLFLAGIEVAARNKRDDNISKLASEIRAISDHQQSVLEWKSTIPQRMQAEADKLKLEVLTEVTRTLGETVVSIREGQARIQARLEMMAEKLDAHMESVKK